MIGSLGDVIFEVSDKTVKTFRELSLSRTANYSEHVIHGHKSLVEFENFPPATLSFAIRFDYSLGVNPYDELRAFRKLFTERQVVPFTIGDEVIGDCLWVIESYDEKFEDFTADGKLISCDVSIKLKEYVTIDEEES